MGCDIHVHVEYRSAAEAKRWEYFGEVTIDRNYGLFARMAGVRNHDEVIPVDEPRGLPSDMASSTACSFDEWKDDAHSASWLTPAEFRRAASEGESHRWHDVAALIAALEAIEKVGLEVRIVFWFDN